MPATPARARVVDGAERTRDPARGAEHASRAPRRRSPRPPRARADRAGGIPPGARGRPAGLEVYLPPPGRTGRPHACTSTAPTPALLPRAQRPAPATIGNFRRPNSGNSPLASALLREHFFNTCARRVRWAPWVARYSERRRKEDGIDEARSGTVGG